MLRLSTSGHKLWPIFILHVYFSFLFIYLNELVNYKCTDLALLGLSIEILMEYIMMATSFPEYFNEEKKNYFKVLKVKTFKKFKIFTEQVEVFTQPLKYPESSKMGSDGIWGKQNPIHSKPTPQTKVSKGSVDHNQVPRYAGLLDRVWSQLC